MAWAECLQVSSFVIFSCVLIYMLYKCSKLKRIILGSSEVDENYVRTKTLVEEYLNEKEENFEISRFQNIMILTKYAIFHRVKYSGFKYLCYPVPSCKYEESLKNVFQILLWNLKNKVENKTNIIKALRFLLKSKTMKHPFDIVASRRVLVMFETLGASLKEEFTKVPTEIETPLLEVKSAIMEIQPIYWNTEHLKLLLWSSFWVILLFFPFYGYDWVSDLLVLTSNYNLSVKVQEAFTNVNSTQSAGISRKSFRNSIPFDIAGFLLIISTFYTLPNIKTLIHQIQIKCIMENPNTETEDVQQVNIKSVLKRNDASLIESATESSIQVVFQWGSYMGLSYLVGKFRTHYVGSYDCSAGEDFSLATVCDLRDTVAFRSNIFLWASGLGGIMSLTMAQFKSHNVQHEFCTTLKMKVAFALSALMNTLSHMMLCVSMFTSGLDFNNLITDKLEAENYNSKLVEFSRTSLAVVLMIIVGFLSVLARYLIFTHKTGKEYRIQLKRNPSCSSLKRFTKLYSFLKNMKNWLRNYLRFLSLPTSQFFYKDEYFCYQSMITLEYVNFFMVQCILYIFFMLFNTLFIGINMFLIFSPFNNTPTLKLAPSMVSRSRQNFAILSSVVVPCGWALSYLFHWVYFKLDHGIFSGTNMRFKYHVKEAGDNISGVWEDLYDYKECVHCIKSIMVK